MQEEPTKSELPIEDPPLPIEDPLPREQAKPADNDEEKMQPPRRKLRWFAFGAAMLLVLVIVLAVALPLTLDDDSSDDSSSSDDGGSVSGSMVSEATQPVEDLKGEPNILNYKDGNAFEADLTRALRDHVQLFIQERRPLFRCWYPYDYLSNATEVDSGATTGEPGGNEGDDKTDSITELGTNVQEESVDEADVMKADANFVYAAYGQHIVIWDRDGNQVDDVTLTGDGEETQQDIRALLITESYLVAIVDVHDNYNYEDIEATEHIVHNYLSTEIRLYRRTGTGSLEFVANKNVHGTYVNARSIGDTVYIQTQSCLNVQDHLLDFLPDRDVTASAAEYSNKTLALAEDFVIPFFVQKLESELKMATGALPTMLKISPWHKDDDEIDYLSYLTQVTTCNVNDSWNENNELTVAASAHLGRTSFPYMYATLDKLVLATTRGSHEPYYRGNLTSLVALEMDSHQTRFLSVGTIEGDLLNQYALDIVGNELRSATTVDRNWVPWFSEESRTANYMTVTNLVSDREGQMLEKGRVKIGKPNERIMSVRFFDNIAYAVTFEQTDPFYVLDMNVPEVLGELLLPGFSSYLHSMNADNSLLVAVGEGADRGLVVTVFDATNPVNPKPLVQSQFGSDSGSNARWDYKAFRFLSVGKVIIPIEIRRRWNSSPDEYFDGFIVLDVSTDGITEDYRVTHTRTKGTCSACFFFGGQRSFVYSGDLMTIKNGMVVSTDLDDGEEVWRLILTLQGEKEYCCW